MTQVSGLAALKSHEPTARPLSLSFEREKAACTFSFAWRFHSPLSSRFHRTGEKALTPLSIWKGSPARVVKQGRTDQ